MTSFLVTPIIVIMVTIIKLCTFLHASRATDATYRAPPLYHVCARVTYDVIAFPVADTTTAAGRDFRRLGDVTRSSASSQQCSSITRCQGDHVAGLNQQLIDEERHLIGFVIRLLAC